MFRDSHVLRTKQVISDAIADTMLAYALQHRWKMVTIISDSNTYPLIGQEIHSGLRSGGIRNSDIILSGMNLIADERSVMSVLTAIDIETDALVAIGSGTITDIVRFVSHRLQKEFVSIPTAPSVDGYTSLGAPLILRGYKRYIACNAPSLLIASPSILSTAPHNMIIAGFGEIMGKVIAIADLELAHILTEAPFDREIADYTLSAYSQTVENLTGIANREPEAVMTLFKALTVTGESMRRFGSSDSISGSEHHISHLLEMRQLMTDSPLTLHGIKVALGTIISAQWYRSLRNTNRETVSKQPLRLPEYETDIADIEKLLGEPGTIMLEENTYISTLDLRKVSQIRTRLLDHWDELQAIAEQVPEPQQLAEIFKSSGGSVSPHDINITSEEISIAAHLSHYVRNRFTIKTLLFTLGLPSDIELNYL